MKNISLEIISKIRKIIKNKKGFLHEPYMIGNEKKYLNNCVDTTFVSSSGKYISKFENKIKNFTKSKFVALTNSGTSALHIAYLISGIRKNDEILIPNLNYVASSNVACYVGAIPHFIENDYSNLGINISKLESYLKEICFKKKGYTFNKFTKNRISSIVVTHLYGSMCDMRRLLKLCKKYNFKLIEDAAEALGSFYNKKHAGTFGDVGILSFNGNKTITTGSGGAILLRNKNDKKKAEKLINISKVKKKNYITFDNIGYNYRISNIQSALGLAQMENLKKIIKKKKKLNLSYKKEFKNCDYARIFETEKNCSSNYWINLLVIEDNYIHQRHQIEKKMRHHNIEIRSSWDLMHRLPHFSNNPKMKLNISVKMNRKILYLPSSPKYA